MITDVAGTITNTDAVSEDYIITVYANTNQGGGTGFVQVIRVAPGATTTWSTTAVVTNAYPGKSVTCGVLNLNAASS